MGCAAALLLSVGSQGEELPAHAVAAFDGDEPRIEVDLLLDSAKARAGSKLRAGVRMRMDPGWHVYWKNSGDVGYPSEVEWRSPDGSFGPVQYPMPEVFIESGGLATTYGYSGDVMLFSDFLIAREAAGSIRVEASARFLVCKVQCIPGQVELATMVPVEASLSARDARNVAIFDRFSAELPSRPVDLGLRVTTRTSVASVRPGETFELSIAVAPCKAPSNDCPTHVEFAESPHEVALDAPESIELDPIGTLDHPSGGPGALLVLRGRVLKGHVVPERISGVLSLLIDGKAKGVEVSLGLSGSGGAAMDSASGSGELGPPPSSLSPSSVSLWFALGFGLLGGLILNLMPCVLPVLALKAYRIIEAGGADPQERRAEGAAFTLGVLLSMVALASVVLAMRSAGAAVGWGFQFQSPGFLAFMGALLTIFALNLFGVFEITLAPNRVAGIGSGSSATLRSFFDGTLAVLLATPCSAPFLGTAVGFAFAGSPGTVILVFLAIGLGLALPYLVVSFVPGLASRLPKPGAWMGDVRTLLGFALLATVVWLLWIAGRSIGVEGVVWLVGGWVGIGLIAWIFGRMQGVAGQRSSRFVAAVLVVGVAFVAVGIQSLLRAPEGSDVPGPDVGIAEWDPAAVRRVVEAGQVAFVDFTADWCLSCKLNERMVLSRPEVEDAMRRLEVAHFRADWTLRDEEIFAELQRHGRAGVPLYLVYRGGAPEDPEVLPEILTIDRVVAALQDASRVREE